VRDLAKLPKVHLHVHLESTIRVATLRELGVEVPDVPPRFTGFRAFADHNTAIRECLRTRADFVRVAREFCADEAAQGTRYAEVTFTAAAHGERLGDPDLPLTAVLEGLALGRAEHGLECRVLLDHSRRRPVERAAASLRLAERYAPEVAGIGLAGDEDHPVEPFAGVFAAARDAGLHVVHHAGETAGPASIRAAIGPGRAERIGHGIRVLDDPALVAEVRDRGIALEVCPSSNVTLGLVPSLSAHPLPRLRDAGLAVTVSTDIPNLTGRSLTAELTAIRDTFGFGDADFAALNRAAIDASFAPPATKRRLHAETDAWLAGSP
jgi:adenosine deaminase